MTTITTPSATRPSAGTWTIDPGHADVGFIGRHLGLTKIRGRFVGVTGTVHIADELTRSSVEVVIDMASVASGDVARDDHLRSADFFDVARHPTATFRSTSVSTVGAAGTMSGVLTIKGISLPVELDVEFVGEAVDPWENERAVFHASGIIDREAWGLTWNLPLAAGGLLVSRQIRLEIDVELVRQPG